MDQGLGAELDQRLDLELVAVEPQQDRGRRARAEAPDDQAIVDGAGVDGVVALGLDEAVAVGVAELVGELVDDQGSRGLGREDQRLVPRARLAPTRVSRWAR